MIDNTGGLLSVDCVYGMMALESRPCFFIALVLLCFLQRFLEKICSVLPLLRPVDLNLPLITPEM